MLTYLMAVEKIILLHDMDQPKLIWICDVWEATLKLLENHLLCIRIQQGCVIVLINACRGLKLQFMPQDIWDNFNLWSTERTCALTQAAGGL